MGPGAVSASTALTRRSPRWWPAQRYPRKARRRWGDYRGFYANVRDAILGTAPLAVTPEDGFRVIRLLELARQSSAEGRTLMVKF